MPLPTEVNVLGKRYSIVYVDDALDVDPYKRRLLWGYIDYRTRTIRVHGKGVKSEDVWHTIIHEIIHAIGKALNIDNLCNAAGEKDVDLLALALTDVLIRNDWLKREENND